MKILFEKDKQKHALVGAFIGLFSIWFPAGLIFTLGCAIAIGKEVYDYYRPLNHTPDVSDALVTIGALSLAEVLVGFVFNYF